MPPEARPAAEARHKVRRRIWRLTRQIGRATDEKARGRLSAELRQAVTEEFDARQALHEHKLARLEEEIRRVRAELKDRREHRKQIIAERVEKLLKRASRRPGRGPGRATATTRQAR